MNATVQFLIRHGYLVLFCWIAAEQAALPVPSVPVLLACGALARAGRLNPLLILFYGWLACLLADSIWFQLGKRRGGRVLRLLCRMALEPDSCVRRTENVLLRYGLSALLVAKFVPGLNAVTAPLAGSSGTRALRFAVFDSFGSLIWIASYAAAGYVFADQLEVVAGRVARTGLGLAVAIIGLIALWIGWKFLQRKRFLRKLAISRITPEELAVKLRSGVDALLVDLRHNLAGDQPVIAGALRIPAEQIEARHREIPRNRDIILFCS